MDIDELRLKFKTGFRIVTLLIVINVLMFLISEAVSFLFTDSSTYTLLLLGAEFLPDIVSGQIWRMITSAFLHAGILHLVINMWALWNIGGIVERFYGGKKVFLIYIFTAFTASLLSVLSSSFFYFLEGDPQVKFSISVGASGAIFGLVGLILGERFKNDTYSVSISDYVNYNQLLVFVGYNVLIGLGFNLLGGSSLINNWAHIGGLLGGMVLGIFLEPINSYNKSHLKKIMQDILLYLCIIAAVASFIAQTVYLIFIFY